MKGLILTGGAGTRLRPLTHTGPKQLIPIANKPNVLYCLEDLRDAGVTDIGVILGDNQPEKVRELLMDGSEYGVEITYIDQGSPKGIAHAVLCAETFTKEEPFCVYLGDNVLKGGIRAVLGDFLAGGPDAEVLLCAVPNPEKFGVAEIDKAGNILSLVEKPKEPKSNLALVGIYFLRKSIFPIIRGLKPSWRNELEITEALDGLQKQGGKIKAHVVTGWWKDTGRPEDILEANRLVLDDFERRIEGRIEDGARVEGRVQAGKGTVIKAGSVVRGPTIIGQDCVIGPNTYIGPYTSIGDGSHLVEADIEASIVVGDCVIEGTDKIVNSLIGRHSAIRSRGDQLPRGHQFFLGENSTLIL